MRTFAITEILGRNLIARPLAQDLRNYINNSTETDVTIDFKGVEFASRSFMDEFYNLFLKNDLVKIVNMPSDICTILNAVKSTQNKKKTAPENADFYQAKDIEDMDRWFAMHSI